MLHFWTANRCTFRPPFTAQGVRGGGFVDQGPVKARFLAKIKKYITILETRKLPMVVAFTHNWESETLYLFDSVYAAIAGNEQLVTFIDRGTGNVVDTKMDRANDGVMSKEKSKFASAFMHVIQNATTDWRVKTVMNGSALYPLSFCFYGDGIDNVCSINKESGSL